MDSQCCSGIKRLAVKIFSHCIKTPRMTKFVLSLLVMVASNFAPASPQTSLTSKRDGQYKAQDKERHAVATVQPSPTKQPSEINLTLELAELPGITNPKSFWEGAYEIRIADWKEVEDKTKAGNLGGLGEVLSRSSFSRHRVSDKTDWRVRVSIPVRDSLLLRLQQEAKAPQAFLLRATIRIFDAQLDQNVAFELNRIWQSKLFPDGEAIITIKIKPDGSYSTWGPVPKELPAGYSIIGLPAKKDAPPKP